MLKRVIAMYIRLSLEDGDVDWGNKTESNSIGNQRMLYQIISIAEMNLQIMKFWSFVMMVILELILIGQDFSI